MTELTLGDILAQAKTIQQVSRLPRAVETTAKNIEVNFQMTAEALVKTAERLESRALSLRDKAETLLQQRTIAVELRTLVEFERTAHDEVVSLALVDVGIRETD